MTINITLATVLWQLLSDNTVRVVFIWEIRSCVNINVFLHYVFENVISIPAHFTKVSFAEIRFVTSFYSTTVCVLGNL